MKIIYFLLLVLCFLSAFSCGSDNNDKPNLSRNENITSSDSIIIQSISGQESLLKDFKLDSIIIYYDVLMWCQEYKFTLLDDKAYFSGRKFFGKWGKDEMLSKKHRYALTLLSHGLYISKEYNIFKKKIKANEYVEGDFTEIKVTFYGCGFKQSFTTTTADIQDGFYVEFSDQFESFNEILFKHAKKYSYPLKI